MNRESLALTRRTLSLLEQITHYCDTHQQQAYLVGGSVRNLLLHEPCTDWDIVLSSDASKVARQLANRLGGFYVHMHDRASRIVVKDEQQEIVLDISSLHDHSIEADLRQRDFTFNAIACSLPDVVQCLRTGEEPFPLIDPLHGADDLGAHCIRAVDDAVFQHDPLRMLRAFRFATRYQLTIEPQTATMIKRDAALLTQSAPARIHEELYAILQPAGATQRLRSLDAHGLFTVLMPEFIPARGMPQPDLHYWDVLEHSLEAVAALERLDKVLQQSSEELQHSPLETGKQGDLAAIQTVLYEAQRQDVFHLTTLASEPMKMAALLHDIGKPTTYAVDEEGHITFYHHPQVGAPLAQHIMQRLHASTRDRRLVQQVVAHHMRPGQLSRDPVTARAIRRYFVDLGPTGIHVALVSLADHLAMRGPEKLTEIWQRHLALVRLLLTRYIREREHILPPRLIQAEELMRRLNIQPGPLVGELLEHIAEAQAEGTIHSKEDALWHAEEFLNARQSDH